MQIKNSQDHQYVIVEDDVGTVAITNYTQEKLNEVTIVELPHVGAQVQKGGAVCVVLTVGSTMSGPRWSISYRSTRRRRFVDNRR
jgi:glycine cleavage system H lipoate-binding protein